MKTRAEVAALIQDAIRDFGMTAKEINNGNCDEFAEFLVARFPDFQLEQSTADESFTHDWVSYNGLHYDAETPEGVETRQEIGTKPEHREVNRESTKGARTVQPPTRQRGRVPGGHDARRCVQ